MASQIFSGLRVLRNVLALRREAWLGKESLEAFQGRELARQVHLASETEFYANLIERPRANGGNWAGLSSLPITEKAHVRDSPGRFIHPAADRARLTLTQTSGTSGVPVSTYSDRSAVCMRHSLDFTSRLDCGIWPAYFTARIHRTARQGKLSSQFGLNKTLHLSLFEGEEKNLEILARARPDAIICCPSYALILAKLNSQRVKPLRVKRFLCGSEVLTAHARREISASFSCPVFNAYGNYEFGYIAWECPEGHSMHVTSRAILEIADCAGKPMKRGEGDILITALYNRAMPLLRYRIGDRGRWGQECACGRALPVLESICGRTNEVFTLPSGRVRSASCFFNIEPVFSSARIYQIVQEREDLFVLRYVPDGAGISPKSRSETAALIRKACLGESINVEFEEAHSLEREKGGKFRKFMSRVRVPSR